MALVTTMLTAIGSSGGGGGGGSPGVIVFPVVAATTTALTVTYANGASGVGATLTNAGAQAAFQIDGVSPTAGQRVLIKDQSSTFQNGIYSVTVVGTGATNWVLTRTTDFDEPGEMTAGVQVDVSAGTVNSTTVWILSASVAVVGTNAVTFVAASDAGYTASRALVTNSAGRVVVATTTATEIGFVNGVTSAIQTQIDSKISQTGAQVYAASATGNDTYAVTLSPVPAGYVNGMVVRFKPDTANTGTASLNVNTLGAITIVKFNAEALETGDILANQIVTVVYNSTGTVFQMVNPQTATTGTGALVRATSPTLVTPALGTPASGTLTNCTGLPSSGVLGTATNDSAGAGILGQIVSSSVAVGSAITATANTAVNVTSISLTAGDWDVSGNVLFANLGTVPTTCQGAISTTSATFPDASLASKLSGAGFTAQFGFPVPTQRLSLSGSATAYLIAYLGANTDGTVCGTIYARRAR